jgi:copper resistance protein D
VDAWFVAVRAIHFAACMLLAGELLFFAVIAGGAWRRNVANGRALDVHMNVVAACACVAILVSGIAWLLFEAANMSGTPIGRALADGTPQVVLRETAFGHVFMWRAIAFVALVAAVAAFIGARSDAMRAASAWIALVLATLELVTLAFAGHAGAASDARLGAVHAGGDMVHLAAAGGWVGALPALVFCLGRRAPIAALARITLRFSVLGVACVALLIASGIINTLLLVGSIPALFGTSYGRWLLAKLVVFAVMLGLACVNRRRMTPRIVAGDANGAALLRRNAIFETVGGAAIVAIVGALGTMVPGAHQSPLWPFPYTLDVSSSSIEVVPAFPTTYATSPVAYTVDAVGRGRAEYAGHCTRCHGSDGDRDGPDAAFLAIKPSRLGEHALHRRPGNVFWWIAHGIPGTPMPAFSPLLGDTSIWQIVQYLIAHANAESAMAIGPRVDAQSTIRVPDFSYEMPGQGQQTLRGQGVPTLIVLYSLPASRPRLDELAQDHRLMHAPLRIVAVPMNGGASEAFEGVRAESNAGKVYATFAMMRNAPAPAHAELLVDAVGVLRARWLHLPASKTDRDAQITEALQRLPNAPPPRSPEHHGH